MPLNLETRHHSYQCGVSRVACFLSSSDSDAGSGAGFGSGAGSSLCADGLMDVEAELCCLCASTHPETEEQETLQ